jgi:hypothetical protein
MLRHISTTHIHFVSMIEKHKIPYIIINNDDDIIHY